MKKQTETDERVVQERRRVQSDACQLLVFGLLLAALIQQIFFHAPLAQYGVELAAALLAGGYVTVRNLLAGNGTSSTYSAKKTLLGALGSGALAAVLVVALAGFTAMETLVFFLCFVPACFITIQGISWLNARRRKELDQTLDDE